MGYLEEKGAIALWAQIILAGVLLASGKITFCTYLIVCIPTLICSGWFYYEARKRFLKACDEYLEHFGERYPGDPRKK